MVDLHFCIRIIQSLHVEGHDFPSFPQCPIPPAFVPHLYDLICMIRLVCKGIKISTVGLWAAVQALSLVYKKHLTFPSLVKVHMSHSLLLNFIFRKHFLEGTDFTISRPFYLSEKPSPCTKLFLFSESVSWFP